MAANRLYMKDTNWEKWTSIAEIFSSVAIFITLINLAIQTQQNTDAILSSARQAVLDSDQALISQSLEYPFLLTTQTMEQFNNLTDVDKARMFLMSASLFRTRENYWMQYQSEVIDAETWRSYRDTLVYFISSNEYMKARWDAITEERAMGAGFLNETNTTLDKNVIGGYKGFF
jgi:hypothetical protein